MKDLFKFETIDNFDNHINLSIPNYSGLSDIFKVLATEYITPKGVCVDLGCSTGRFLDSLDKIDASYIGVDSVKMKQVSDSYVFTNTDALHFLKGLGCADVIVSMFFLQFLGGKQRTAVLGEIKRIIKNGAVLLIAEKVYLNNARVSHTLHRDHIRCKRQGFTDKEILDKDQLLFGTMFCNSDKEMKKELSYLGSFDQVWQSYNFKAWIVYSR